MSQNVSNGDLTVWAPDTVAGGVGQNDRVRGYHIGVANPVKGETVQAVIMTNNGDLNVFGQTGSYTGVINGVQITGGRPTCITLTGSVGAVNKALATLTNEESSSGDDELWINVSDSQGDNTNSDADTLWTPLTIAAAPTVQAPTGLSGPAGVVTAVSGIKVLETGRGPNETFTVTLTTSRTVMTDTGAGVTGSGTTTLTLQGKLGVVNADLANLAMKFKGADTLVVSVTDSFGNVVGPTDVALNASAGAGSQLPRFAQAAAGLGGGGSATADLTPQSRLGSAWGVTLSPRGGHLA